MNIIFISYWGIREGLTQSTVLPHVRILASYNQINKIALITIERGKRSSTMHLSGKVRHIPIRSRFNSDRYLGKILDFILVPRLLKRYCIDMHVSMILARGGPAGALAYLTWKKIKVPFYVESFEPHSTYMRENGVWGKRDLRYIFQRKWERKIKLHAAGLITVTHGYRNKLIKEGIVNCPVKTAPCAVDTKAFAFNSGMRTKFRDLFNIPGNTVTGIYVGKFGGIYYDEESFHLFNLINSYYRNHFFLIILSPDNPESIKYKLQSAGYPTENYVLENVEHDEISGFLSAADFGMATVRSNPSSLFCSPVKTGEYWASGLPVLMTEGIGDESEYLEKENGGAFIDMRNISYSLEKIERIIREPDHRERISRIARKYRSFEMVKEAYESLVFKDLPKL